MKTVYTVSIIIILFVFPNKIISQVDLPTIIPPSPTVGSLMRFEEVPVDNYNGKPNITFPIFNKEINGVSIPIVLRYDTMGLRVDERSGWVGTGWALDGEAMISRTVMGIPDELDQRDHPSQHFKQVGVFHNGYYDLNWSNFQENLSNYEIQEFLWNASNKGSIVTNEGGYDTERDIYQLSLFGKTAKFIIEKQQNQNVLEVKFLKNDSNLKIELSYDFNSFKIERFTVFDTNNLQYIFEVEEQTESESSHFTTNFNNDLNIIHAGSVTESNFTSSWKINQIKLNNQNLVSFFYQDIIEEFHLPVSKEQREIMGVLNSSDYDFRFTKCSLFGLAPCGNEDIGPNSPFWSYNGGLLDPKESRTNTKVKINSKKISRIKFIDKIEIRFQFDSYHPEYENSGVKLSQIKILDETNLLNYKTFNFNYSTTSRNRLFLDEIIENNVNSYLFSYHDKERLPFFGSDKKDIWGYYKDVIESCFKIEYSADKNDVKTGVLTSITYPNGGVKEFEFESNTYSYNGDESFEDQFYLLNNKDNSEMILRGVYADNINNTSIGNYSYSRPFEIVVEQPICMGSNGDNDVAVCRLEKLIDGRWEGFALPSATSNDRTTILSPGFYRLTATVFDVGEGNPISVQGSILYRDFTLKSKFMYGGGLRIKSIKFKNIDDLPNVNKDYNYNEVNESLINLPEGEMTVKSNGVIDGFLTNLKEYNVSKKYTFALFNGQGGNSMQVAGMEGSVRYKVKKYLNNVFNAPFTSNSVGYSKVTIKSSSDEEFDNGHAELSYTTPKEFPTFSNWFHFSNNTTVFPQYPTSETPFNDKSNFQGKLLESKVYDSDNRLITKTNYDYFEPIENNIATSLFIYNYNCNYVQFYNKFEHYLNKFPSTGRHFVPSHFIPKREKNCVYNNIQSFPENYQFVPNLNFNKYLLKDKTTNNYFYSNSNVPSITNTRESFTYNDNYLLSSKTIYNNDQLNYKTEYTYATEPDSVSDFTQEELSVIDQMVGNNLIDKPILTKTYKNDHLLSTQKVIYASTAEGLLLPSRIQTSKGELGLEDRLVYHKYDVVGNLLEVSKKDGSRVCYVWGYNKTLPIAKMENIQYSDIPISELNALNSFDYTTGTETQLLTLLNNLRSALPSTAMITTMTHKPLVGVSTITDPKGDKQTYHYDGFNRLQYVKDAQGNILQEHDYHYRNEN